MRTLQKIVECCKSGGKPTIDEARLAICVLDALFTFETMRLMRRSKNSDEAWRDYEDHFNRCRNVFSQSPLDYLGDEYNPDNPEVKKARNISIKLMDKIMSS